MTLRTRLTVNTLAAALVVLILMFVGTDYWRNMDADRLLLNGALAAMANGGRSACESAPSEFGGGVLEPLPAPGLFAPSVPARPQVFAYSSAFVSQNVNAPAFPDYFRTAMAGGARQVRDRWDLLTPEGRQLAVRMSWNDGPCAIVLSRFAAFPVRQVNILVRLAVVGAVLTMAGFLAAGSIIGRIGRLTAAVGRSASSNYTIEVPLTGSDEIGQLESAFNSAGRQMRTYVAMIESREAAIKERETMLRSVVTNTTHDVALPLTVIQGHLSGLDAAIPADSPAQHDLRGAIRETHYLTSLLHNLGAAARLDNPMPILELRTIDLNPLIERIVARHRGLAATLNVEIGAAVPEQPVYINADVTLIEQAANNLVHNAVHYNHVGGHVAILLTTLDQNRRFSFRVIDDGPGIAPDERENLTTRRFRGSAGRARRPDGQGLGLHIVREVVERHGFDLRIGASEYGGLEVEIAGACRPEHHGGVNP